MSTNEQLHFTISGMTCTHCESLIGKTLRALPGVSDAQASYIANTADVTFDPEVLSRDDLERAIDEIGYRVVPESDAKLDLFMKTTLTIAIVAVAFIVIQRFGLLNYLVPSQVAQGGMSYGMLFVIGLITSVHCIAMCGGINLSQSLLSTAPDVASSGTRTDAHPVLASLKPSLAYNAGRVVSYTTIGAILGLIGLLIGNVAGSALPEAFQGALKIFAGVVMVVMGINMLGLFSGMRALSLPVPRGLARRLGRAGASTKRPFIVGLLNGLMPCGPLQSMQIIALASGNPLVGAASMFVFSLGTVPLMLGLGSAVSALGTKFQRTITTVGALLVTVLGLALLLQGNGLANLLPTNTLVALVLFAGVLAIIVNAPIKQAVAKVTVGGIVMLLAIFTLMQGFSPAQIAASEQLAQVKVVNGTQVVTSTLESGTYPSITVRAGKPVRWVINADKSSINGCNATMVISDYNVQYTFQPGENVIEFTPTKTGTSRVTCWMGMIEGSITVVQ